MLACARVAGVGVVSVFLRSRLADMLRPFVVLMLLTAVGLGPITPAFAWTERLLGWVVGVAVG